MITAVIDTNILVRGTIASHPKSASKQIVDALFIGRFALLLSSDAIQEIQRVLTDPAIMAKHGRSIEDVGAFCRALELMSRMFEPTTYIPASLTRDVTDTKWVALALDSQADYLVTADRRHLLRLQRIGKTKVIGPRPFLELISK
jgi:putative PIN family toxin of toxin-antitoxin system